MKEKTKKPSVLIVRVLRPYVTPPNIALKQIGLFRSGGVIVPKVAVIEADGKPEKKSKESN